MAVDGQSDKMSSDMEVWMKQGSVIVLFYEIKMAPTDIHQHSHNVYGDQSVDLSTVRWWVVRFSSGNSDSASPPLVQIFMSTACSLFFITGKNAQLMLVTDLTRIWRPEPTSLNPA